MEDTCWIKDEHGRFQGRRPGCKMEKADSGVLPVADSTGDNAAEVNDYKVVDAAFYYTDLEKQVREILRKPESQRTKEDNELIQKYLRGKAAEVGKQWKDTILTNALTLMFGAESVPAILAALAMGIALDELMKYAEEKFPGYGALGVMLAAIILTAAKVKLDAQAAAKAEQKVEAAVAKEKAAVEAAEAKKAAAAEKAAAEKKAAEEAAKKEAAEAEQKAAAEKKAAAEAEKKAAEETAKASEKIGGIYDETANNYKYDPKAEAQKKANIVNSGDVTADDAKTVNELAKKAGSSTDVTGYKTEVSQWDIEHSMEGHAEYEVKKKISDEKEAAGETVRNKYKIPEEKRVVEGGKHNVSLTKEDYQNIPNYRKEAIEHGSLEFQPKTGNQTFEAVKYKIPQSDGVIHMVYRINPVNEKMTFVTMWKVGYK
ncbi:MAG: hypothetical protein HQK98_10840 [Nitrospirae bacterium]|nr:hypothetical protein [Nitrospirota bacterium]